MNFIGILQPKYTVTFVEREEPLKDTAKILKQSGYTTIPVIDDNGKYLGTVSEGDILWYLWEHGLNEFSEATVETLVNVSRNPSVQDTADIRTIVTRIMEQNFLCIVDDRGCFIGIITRKDVIAYMMETVEEKGKDAGI
ncbi:MAG TPA: CBS domain-containing protein [Lachnospiraceae bacterium]|nr:CBS domain-containing protein [Lachnospiraceae bacterium]HPF29763.1 CBS domain-containing protein [Lachnospiraceae bacterium]